jgi:hypothetical protein
MNEEEFIREHKRLIKTLLSGDKAKQVKEAEGQAKELKMRGGRNSAEAMERKAQAGSAPWRYAHKSPAFF